MSRREDRKRGVVVVQVAVGLTTLVGFMALAIDVGAMYTAKTEIQRAADSAALAAATELGDYTDGDPMTRARTAAADFANRNKVLNSGVGLDASDVVFGQAHINQDTGKYVFTETTDLPNAVKVRLRRTTGSPSGPMSLFFARVFGIQSANLAAQATAVLTPRDIAFVLDLSGSHNDDSCLVSCKKTEVSNRGVWEYLWDTTYGAAPVVDGLPSGPSFGNMNLWGDAVTGPNGINTSDPGLFYLPRNSNWTLTSAFVSQTLSAKGYGTYTADELSAINSKAYDGDSSYYKRRVQIALGLIRWKSGLTGGQDGGNGDSKIDSTEVVTMVSYPSSTTNPTTKCKKVGGSWSSFCDYVMSSSSSMCVYNAAQYKYGDSNCRYRYGLKTWLDYVQNSQPSNSASPGLAGSPEQPMGAVADAVKASIDIITALQSNDLVGMAGYGTNGYGPDDKPSNMSWLTDDLSSVRAKVDKLQASMWTSTTNLAQGIDEGVKVLFNSSESRPNAAKVMILLTDGRPNQTRANPTQSSDEFNPAASGYTDAKAAAQDAAALGVRIYTISVGASCDLNLMQTIASYGHGETFHAEGSVATYQAELQQILQDLGGKRPVILIQ